MVITTPEEHRALAAEYIRLAEITLAGPEQRVFSRLAQEHLLLVKWDPNLVSPR